MSAAPYIGHKVPEKWVGTQLPALLGPHEELRAVFAGQWGQGLLLDYLVVTSRRLLFVDRALLSPRRSSIFYDDLTAVEDKHLLGRGKLLFHHRSGVETFQQMRLAEAASALELIRPLIPTPGPTV